MTGLKTVTERLPVGFVGEARCEYSSTNTMDWEEAKPGVFAKLLYQDEARGERTMLIRLEPGAKSAPHCHKEFEQVYVIEGSFEDGERVLNAGDFCCRSPGQVHTAYCRDGAVVLVTYS